jgi:hypothetical protein
MISLVGFLITYRLMLSAIKRGLELWTKHHHDGSISPEASTMNIFRAPLIAAAVLAMTSCVSYAQVRVIGPDSEHVYSSDPREAGRLLDDEALQRENERRERARIERQREREVRRRELDAAAAAQAAPTAYDEPYGAEDGSYDVGTLRSRRGRQVNLRRIGTGPVSGNSLQFRHANARIRR